MKNARRTISAAQFKAHCIALLDKVGRTRETLVVTKRGRPVATVVALAEAHCPTPAIARDRAVPRRHRRLAWRVVGSCAVIVLDPSSCGSGW